MTLESELDKISKEFDKKRQSHNWDFTFEGRKMTIEDLELLGPDIMANLYNGDLIPDDAIFVLRALMANLGIKEILKQLPKDVWLEGMNKVFNNQDTK